MSRSSLVLVLIAFSAPFLFILIILFKGKNKEAMIPKNPLDPSRPPAVAGAFYPTDAKIIQEKIDSFLSQTKKVLPDKPQILIVPHAGIDYSGQTAAWGFKQIENKNYNKVIILGASHQHWFDHAAVYSTGSWETPLGKVPINEPLAEKIIDENKSILADKENHQREHSLEMELIFLQKVLANFEIVPILVSQTNPQLLDDLAKKIADSFDERTLLVVSTDFSHYPPYETAKKADEEIIEAILSRRAETFQDKFAQVKQKNYPGLETPACGSQAIIISLKVGELIGIKNYQKLAYQNSGDTPQGDRQRVVGYAAIAGWGSQTNEELDSAAQKEALAIARQTLKEYLVSQKIPQIKPKNKALEKKLGAFVTLEKNGQLRGCIGQFEPDQPLYQVIQQMAVAAAVQDHRFSPVTADELDQLTIEISVMRPKKKISDWRKINLGVNGVVIEKEGRSGTFLPQVATDTGWSREEFLSQLCSQKAGLPPDCYKDPKTTIYTFQAQVFKES